MGQISVSKELWVKTFSGLGWASPIPDQIWEHIGAGENTAMDWPRLYRIIHDLGWSDQHAEVLWVSLKKAVQSPAVIVPTPQPIQPQAAAAPQPVQPQPVVAPQPASPQPVQPYPMSAPQPQPVNPLPPTPQQVAAPQPVGPPQTQPLQLHENSMPARPAAPIVASEPAQAAPTHDASTPARWISRCLGSLLDGLIVSIPMGILFGIGLAIAGASLVQNSKNPVTGAPSFDVLGTLLGLLVPMFIALWVPVLYNWLTMKREGDKHGQTIGKGVTGVRVVCIDGSPVGTKEILMRELVGKFILYMLGYIAIAGIVSQISTRAAMFMLLVYFLLWWVIMPWRDPYNRCPHDLVAGTRPVEA